MSDVTHVLVQAKTMPGAGSLDSLVTLQKKLLVFSVFNLLLLSVVGVILRLYPFLPLSFFEYKNLLHAHSHFAFGGWAMPILLAAIMKYFPELTRRISYRQLRNISVSILFSAYGMLLSFPFQGYAAVSIGFSTLSILAGFYMAIVLWKAARGFNTVPVLFVRAGLIFLVLSAIGPFATGPLIAMGKAGSTLYYCAIYFYLHFQYNGWFTFALLGVLYKMMEKNGPTVYGRLTYRLFLISCVPAYFLSTLWSHPHEILYVISMIAAVIQVAAAVFLSGDLKLLGGKKDHINLILKAAVFFFIAKNGLQLISAIPSIADFAYTHRNLTIAYLHMVLIGFISLGAFAALLKGHENQMRPGMTIGLFSFIIAFIMTEVLLVMNAAGIEIRVGSLGYIHFLLLVSGLFPVAIFLIWNRCRKLFEYN